MPEKAEKLGVIEQLLENQKQIMRGMADLRKAWQEPDREWWTTPQMARKKGISTSWLEANRWAHPLGGAGKKKIAGRMRAHWSDVAPWLMQSDEELWKLYGAGSGLPAAGPNLSRRPA